MNNEINPKELIAQKVEPQQEIIDPLSETIVRLSKFETRTDDNDTDDAAHTQSYHDSGHSYTT